ncbi:hypothetical protein BGW80DRAFT_1467765 [Lactifluus volemus]|nr:hypothetical protein BGW80DRAFT_1467765 [Lactifluus volemus]
MPFRSDIPGRPETQFGGWHAMRNKGEEEVVQRVQVGLTESVDWEKIWSRSPEGDILPLALRGVGDSEERTCIQSPPSQITLLRASINHFPLFHMRPRLGLFGSSTPFATGRPYILLYGGSVSCSGADGIALSAGPRPTLQTTFHGLRAITEPLKATRSEGNLVNELDNVNLTTLLISAIEKSVLTGRAAKDDEFYLGVLRDDELWEIRHIMSGGPSRGTMALETETAPGEGTSVQLSHRPNDDAVPTVWPHLLLAALESDSAPVEREHSVTIVEHAFVAASENGFMVRRSDEVAWTCTSPGSAAQLGW